MGGETLREELADDEGEDGDVDLYYAFYLLLFPFHDHTNTE